MNDFLPHIYDPLRQKIALNFAKGEMRKLLPHLRGESVWRPIDEQIEEWPEKLSVRNFWNGIHGISIGFRLKSIVPWITSLNVTWKEREVPLEELWFGGKFGAVGKLGAGENAAAVRDALMMDENRALLEETARVTEEKSRETEPRDSFPIFAVRKEGELKVIDGNRRLMSAVVSGKESVLVSVGEPLGEPPLREHWVPTSLLVDIVFWNKRQVLAGRETTKTSARVIAELIKDSSAGRIEFRERAIHRDDEAHLELLKAVAEILNGWGVKLE